MYVYLDHQLLAKAPDELPVDMSDTLLSVLYVCINYLSMTAVGCTWKLSLCDIIHKVAR